MKTRLILEFDSFWVLEQVRNGEFPMEDIADIIKGMDNIKVIGSDVDNITVEYSAPNALKEMEAIVKALFLDKYGADIDNIVKIRDVEAIFEDNPPVDTKAEDTASVTASDENVPSTEDLEKLIEEVKNLDSDEKKEAVEEKKEEEKEDVDDFFSEFFGKKKEKEDKPLAEILGKINSRVGGAEFKSLVKEIVKIAPRIVDRKAYEAFTKRSYLFSIGDGNGLSTYLKDLAGVLNATKLCKIRSDMVTECRIPLDKGDERAFSDAIGELRYGTNDEMKILCYDIREWMSKMDTVFFRDFLRAIEKHSSEFIFVFRVPFLEKDVLEKIKRALDDLFSVTTVTFPPLTADEIKYFATGEIESYGFGINENMWDNFFTRITEEKSDGRFYGLKTIKKVVRELVYQKELDNAEKTTADSELTEEVSKEICRGILDGNEGMEMLNKLVGSEHIRDKINEIVAQIELSMQQDGKNRPCIHMKFVGNPGTGKTTVARIVGKILKEKGVLRSGNFFEYSGRDFVGRYIGETAPKTASICRDAYGSVLFIDEAYSLFRGDDNDRDFGREALDTLIAEMENHRTDLVVIMAGYTDDINKMMKGNAGLASRMPYTIEFPNFDRDQLYRIFLSMLNDTDDEELLQSVKAYFDGLSDEFLNTKEFANARFVRNLFERTWAKAALRCQLNGQPDVVVTKADFDLASKEKEFSFNSPKKNRIGFN